MTITHKKPITNLDFISKPLLCKRKKDEALLSGKASLSFMDKLPPVLLQSVTDFLPYSDIRKVQITCRSWQNIYPINTLSFSNTYLSSHEIILVINKIPRLISLQLLLNGDYNKENEKIFEKLGESSTLERLDITGYFTNIHIKKLTKSNSLAEINIEGNDEVNNESLSHLAKIKSLKKINVAATRITGKGLVYLHELPQLEEVNVTECRKIKKQDLRAFEIERSLLGLPDVTFTKN